MEYGLFRNYLYTFRFRDGDIEKRKVGVMPTPRPRWYWFLFLFQELSDIAHTEAPPPIVAKTKREPCFLKYMKCKHIRFQHHYCYQYPCNKTEMRKDA